jgi:hypothetical protein
VKPSAATTQVARAQATSMESAGAARTNKPATTDGAKVTGSEAASVANTAAVASTEPVMTASVEPPVTKNLSGVWELTNAVDTTSYRGYLGLRLGYRVRIQQQGSRLVGTGEKLSENGRVLPPDKRTPISFEGKIDGQLITLEFTERWSGGATGGMMSWQLGHDYSHARGRFSSNAAKSSGISRARRIFSSR